jgi:very-short-patch-repair endonuclease
MGGQRHIQLLFERQDGVAERSQLLGTGRYRVEHEGVYSLTNQGIGDYDVDCYWPEYQLVIEVDEDAHQHRFEEDRARDRFLAGLGLRTMRVTDESLREDGRLREEVRRAARIVP